MRRDLVLPGASVFLLTIICFLFVWRLRLSASFFQKLVELAFLLGLGGCSTDIAAADGTDSRNVQTAYIRLDFPFHRDLFEYLLLGDKCHDLRTDLGFYYRIFEHAGQTRHLGYYIIRETGFLQAHLFLVDHEHGIGLFIGIDLFLLRIMPFLDPLAQHIQDQNGSNAGS